ncbi:MAG TPA: hypothetical protein VMA13_06660 [Candidatus Saccharimonadales bacterium]|nr:hypothetical protein [Candidatus Saccharimonadales bacterium]
MKKTMLLVLTLLAGPLVAAAGPKDDILNASKKLADTGNYTWEVTINNANGGGFSMGPNEGKTEKGGYTWYSMTFNDNTTEIVMKGTNAAINTPDNGWQSRAEAIADSGDQPGPGRFLMRMLDNFQTPPKEVEDLVSKTKDIQKAGDACVSDLTEDGAKALLSFRRGRNGGNGPEVSNPKGSVKFWVKDGVLTKYEIHLQGTISFNGNDIDVDRTTTVEIKDVGSTKVTIPPEAEKKLSS